MAQPLLHVVPVGFTQAFVVSEELMGEGGGWLVLEDHAYVLQLAGVPPLRSMCPFPT